MAGLSEAGAVAVRLSPSDNVATLIRPAAAEALVTIRNMAKASGAPTSITAGTDIPAGHKIALGPIPAGGIVRKYGHPIARARRRIEAGEHVHVHNAVSNVPSEAGVGDENGATLRLDPEKLRALITGCLDAAGVPRPAAEAMTDHLVEAHLRGVETHGVRRLKPYLGRLRAGGVAADAEPQVAATAGLLRIDGGNGIGHYVAARAADALAAAAKRQGAAVALIRNSNHFGFAGYYATRIAGHGMAAMVTSNGQVMVAPHGANQAFFSNDPLAIAAPLGDGSFFEFDMATSVTSRANIVLAAARGSPIASGVALDAEGRETTDATAALAGALLPFGGDKGFALIAAIELLTGVLTGGAYADRVASKEADPTAATDTAHFMLAIDLEQALGRAIFEARLSDMVARMGALEMCAGATPPRYPGARRWRLRKERLERGIPLAPEDVDALLELAEAYGLGGEALQFGAH